MNRKKQTAAWMAIVAFSAFSAAAVAADGDSIRSKSKTEQPGESSAPGEHRTNGAWSGSETSGTMDSRSSPAREAAASFARVDRDSNGAIDASEATEAGIDLIGADRDSNGILTATEFEAALGQSGHRSTEDHS